MNFDFSDEQKTLKDQLRRTLGKLCTPQVVRGVLEGHAPYDRALWRELSAAGWISAAIPEEYGGQGLGHETLCCLAEEFGRALAPVPLSSSIYLAAEALLLAGSEAQKRALLPGIASGATIATLALVEGPGALTESSFKATFSGGRLNGTKIAVPDGGVADVAIVAARDAQAQVGLYVVDLAAASVRRETTPGIDPTRPQATLVFTDAPAKPLGAGDGGWALIERLLQRAAILFAFEQIGGADVCLAMARDYALARYAFGRQIGSYQAVKHRLAEVYMTLELARSNAWYGAWALQAGADDLPLAAATARVSATMAFESAARDLTQTLGGIAATWAHDAHLYYRRSRQLAVQLGSVAHWRNAIVDELDRRAAG